MKKGIWIRNKIIPYYLKGAKFALAMLLTEKTLSASQIATAISEKGIKCDRKELGKMLASLERMGGDHSVRWNLFVQLQEVEKLSNSIF